MAIDAAVAGLAGVPPLFCAGDDKCVAEASHFFPGIETVTTKQAMGWSAALSKHPRRVLREIYEGVGRAYAGRGGFSPFTFSSPVTYEIRYKRIENAEAASRGFKAGHRIDPFTVRWEFASITDRF